MTGVDGLETGVTLAATLACFPGSERAFLAATVDHNGSTVTARVYVDLGTLLDLLVASRRPIQLTSACPPHRVSRNLVHSR